MQNSTTNNVAELTAFTRGLQWAHKHDIADGHPVCMRYDSTYAAMIATGVWKAKKHKALAEEARSAWRSLHAKLRGRLWTKHVKGHSGDNWNNRADRLANEGRAGRYRYEPR